LEGGGGALKLRGGDGEASGTEPTEAQLKTLLSKAAQIFKKPSRDFRNADAAYDDIRIKLRGSITRVALLYNELAYRYISDQKDNEALKYSVVAVSLQPEDEDYLDTYAQSVCRLQGPADALQHLVATGMNGKGSEKLRAVLASGSCPG
jgi:hypothetical protein